MESPAILDFFTLEASSCLERLDGSLAQSGDSVPPLDPFIADARALRGSATMARQAPIADVAGGIERVARDVRDKQLQWSPAVRAALIAAVDDLKILVRHVRNWGPGDDTRALARRNELDALAPVRTRRSGESLSTGASSAFLAGEVGRIAVALGADRGLNQDAAAECLTRVRALRGMASLRDEPPLPDVLAAIEDKLLPLERGAGSLDAESRNVIRAAVAVLRRAASELKAGGHPDPDGDEARRFVELRDAATNPAPTADAIVPVAALFHDDAGPHVVSASANPPTTSAQRFRMEVVSQAEHLRGVVAAATGGRITPALRAAISSLRATAVSFGQGGVADFFARFADGADPLDAGALQALDSAATLLADPNGDPNTLASQIDRLTDQSKMDAALGAGFSSISSPTPASIPVTEPRLSDAITPPSGSPSGAGLQALLKSGLAGFNTLNREPLATPAMVEDDDLPLVDDFLYRGRAALDRALELRNTLRHRAAPPDKEELDELFDLLELAAAD